MAGNIKITQPVNPDVVNANDLGEFIWWSIHWNTAPETLLSIIDRVGNSAQKIHDYIFSQFRK